MAANAAFRYEDLEAALLRRGQRVRLATQILIEPRVRRNQRSLECLNCASHILEGDWIIFTRERRFEVPDVSGNAAKRFHRSDRGAVHLHSGLHRAHCLLLQIPCSSVPKLSYVEDRVQHSGAIARTLL